MCLDIARVRYFFKRSTDRYRIRQLSTHGLLVWSIGLILVSHCAIMASEIFQTPDSDNYITRVFTTEDGMPQNSVLAMAQTRDGYIWLATFGGLARFDGTKFKVFTTSNTPELPDNRITYVHEDRHGVLWIRSEGGVLTSYKDGTFTLISKPDHSVIDNILLPVYLDKNDRLWFRNSKRLTTYNTRTKELTAIENHHISSAFDDRIEIEPTSFAEDPDGGLWIATNKGLALHRNGAFTIFDERDGLPDDFISLVRQTPDGRLLVATSGGIGFYKDRTFTKLTEQTAGNFPFMQVGANTKEFLFFNLGRKLYRLSGNELLRFDLPNKEYVHTAFPDNEGNIWVGSNLSLTQYKPRHIKVFWQTGYSDLILPAKSIVQGRDGTVLIHNDTEIITWKDGIFRSPAKGMANGLNTPLLTAAFPHRALTVDNHGAAWIGDDTGLYRFENDSVTKLDTGSAVADENFGKVCLFSKTGEKIWSSSSGKGLQEFQNGKFHVYTVADGLVDNEILSLTEDRSGRLWIASKSGLGSFLDGVFTNFTTANGLTNNHVRDVYEDVDGTLWIGTYGGGISRYRDGKFASITSENGLPENIASRILLDDRDNFWVLGNRGVYSVNRNSLNSFADGNTKAVYCNVYGIADGMKTSEGNGGNQSAGWKTSDGKLWFAMIEGGIIIDPPRTSSNAPPVYIEEVILGKNTFDPRKPIEINPGENQLQVSYTAVQFTQPEQLKFQYKMEGFDEDWQEAGPRRTAFYQFLPSGTYRFRVRAVTSDGVWDDTGAFVDITVRSGLIFYQNDSGGYYLTFSFPFNQYWWLYLLLTLLVIVLAAFLIRRRLRDITRRQMEQQQFSQQLINAHESERRRVAAELHDSIGQSLALIKTMAVYGTKISAGPESSAQFEKIVERSAETIAEIREITYDLRPYLLDKVGLTEEIEKLIDKIALADSVDIHSNIDNINNLFSKDAEMNIYRIIQESFNNILKHSDASEAWIDIKKYQQSIAIKIRDDGRGFDPKDQGSSGFGFGLSGIAERVKMIGGDYSITSKLARGATILINLKLDKDRSVK